MIYFVTRYYLSPFLVGEQCRGRNNVPGTCKLIYECAQAIKDIKAGVGRVLCKTGQIIELVCCANPISIQPAAATTPVDLSRLRMADRSKKMV